MCVCLLVARCRRCTSPCGCRGGVTCLWNCVTALPRCGAVLAAAMGSASAHRTVDLLLCSSVVGSIPSAKRLSDCRCVRFDKLNLIIGADGVAATVFEHSPVDGHTMLPFVDVQPRNCRARRRLAVWLIFRLARHAAGYSVELCGHFAAVACRPIVFDPKHAADNIP